MIGTLEYFKWNFELLRDFSIKKRFIGAKTWKVAPSEIYSYSESNAIKN